MGMSWLSTMVLLSTLAALVIIVHSAEEDYEERNREIRPRSFDVDTPAYEEPWRTIEEPIQKETTQPENWDLDYLEDAPRRRRPRRKRKRRPQLSSDEDTAPQKRYTFNEEIEPFHEPEIVYETSEQPRRRRKRPEMRLNRWAADTDDRPKPLRRRGQGKKRLPPEIKPVYSEFDDPKTLVVVDEERSVHRSDDENPNVQRARHYEPSSDERSVEVTADNYRPQKDSHYYDDTGYKWLEPQTQDEKSVSDFSHEGNLSNEREKLDDRENGQKSIDLVETLQENAPVDPSNLKEILKKSNGASLSEILQKNNLTLADLLHGRAKAIKTLNQKEPESSKVDVKKPNNFESNKINLTESHKSEIYSSRSDHVVEYVSEQPASTESHKRVKKIDITTTTTTTTKRPKKTTSKPVVENNEKVEKKEINVNETLEAKENAPKFNGTRRRIPGTGARRKVRLNLMTNSTQKSQLNRDLMTLTARKYYNQNHRNTSKSREWKDVVPTMLNLTTTTTEKAVENTETVSPFIPDELTTPGEVDVPVSTTDLIDDKKIPIIESSTINNFRKETTQATTITSVDITTKELVITEKPKVTPVIRTEKNNSGSRRQALNNRLKRKRQKHKSTSTESPKNDLLEDVFGMVNLVSASEFIARTQKPRTTISEAIEFSTDLEDFLTTQSALRPEVVTKSLKKSTVKFIPTEDPITQITTEESTKFEIEEILNDTRTSARLSKILMERNMTLSELVEHRERGSSHVHLADIFHNASKEPNPPEPFLSKSLIEPISREIYPLRALLEANLHNTTGKSTTSDPMTTFMNIEEEQLTQEPHFSNIPVVMDFGNNVNENGENMGIMSLFNKFAENNAEINTDLLKKDSDGTPYVTSIISLNTTDPIENARESRILEDEDLAINWNDIFAMMKKQQNETEEVLDSLANGIHSQVETKTSEEKDLDGDGLIVLEDLQHLKDFDDNVASASNEKIEMSVFEKTGVTNPPGILNDGPGNVKSVTVATASIIGLSMILFLLTYAAYKWTQQRKSMNKKDSFHNERIPSPVFENRKGNKNNSSNRSISPMLSSNIYTMNTLDSHNGKDSPDYLWDSLRKPFQ